MRNAMNRLGLLWLVCLLALGVCAPALAEEGENLLSNGGFEDVSGDMPAGWYRGMWVTTAGTTYIESSEDAHTGERAAMVDNVQPNDARLEQTVRVEPQTFYKLSAWVKAEDCGEGLKGANVSFADVYGTSPDVHDTDGEWVEKAENTDFTVDRDTGLVTFKTAPGVSPVTGQDNVRITAHKARA